MNICVIGTGYVGLVTGAGLAEFGMTLTCVDNDQQKIDVSKAGKVSDLRTGAGRPHPKECERRKTPLHDPHQRGSRVKSGHLHCRGDTLQGGWFSRSSAVEEVAEEIADQMDGYKWWL